jgi:hypothetical protein
MRILLQHHHQVPHHSENISIIFKGTVLGDEYFGQNNAHLAVQHHHQVPHHSENISIIFKGTVSRDEYFGKNSFIQNGRLFYFIVAGNAGTDAAPPESIKLL